MGASTEIAWTDHTFNPWWGCQRVSPGCEYCYAEAFAKRTGHRVWGPTAGRREFGPKHWDEVLKWHEAAAKAGERRRVFCASMADVFEDHPIAEKWRPMLWSLIHMTPFLDWLLLTKRPENMLRFASPHWAEAWPRNVWAGTTVEDQKRADERIPELLKVPAKVRFLSCEPLLERVAIHPSVLGGIGHLAETYGNPLIHWVIVGGESGPGARPFDLGWARQIVDQCRAAGAAVFVKQVGRRPLEHVDEIPRTKTLEQVFVDAVRNPAPQGWTRVHTPDGRVRLQRHLCQADAKGGDWDEWPEDLRIREFPRP